jgi:hypothetical protein
METLSLSHSFTYAANVFCDFNASGILYNGIANPLPMIRNDQYGTDLQVGVPTVDPMTMEDWA